MKYFFVLGSNPTLSVAEIMTVFDPEKFRFQLLSSSLLLAETEQELDAAKTIRSLGGTVKIGMISCSFARIKMKEILPYVFQELHPEDGKFKFGISAYGDVGISEKVLGMEIKNHLKEQGVSCRWVTSREKTLSSVVVEQNRLTGKGLELVLIKGNNEFLLGRTLAVQPFKDLSARDYGRPARDDHSGMLPPKLAQIMINLAQKKPLSKSPEQVLLDPFCGSGTILSEALLMGFTDIIGSDLSDKAVSDSQKNLDWLSRKFSVPESKRRIIKSDAAKITEIIGKSSADRIVCEPFLGPQRGKIDLPATLKELNALYSAVFKEFSAILRPGGRVVIIFPVFTGSDSANRPDSRKTQKGAPIQKSGTENLSKETKTINPNLGGLRIINPVSRYFRNNRIIKLTDRETIVYGREGQRVWREIVVLEKIG